MAWFDFLFVDSEKDAVLDWLVEHDNGDYHGFAMTYGYELNRIYYKETYSLDALKQMKEDMIAKHNRYLYEKAHPKPKIGETYKVYLCGNHVDTLNNVTNISSNQNGVFFTITNEDGTTNIKEYFGSGTINWTKK